MKRFLAPLAVLLTVACGPITPAPAPVGAPLTVTQIKFTVMDAVGTPVYCDPDYYPVAREGGEQANAIASYPKIRANAEVYSAIIVHEGLSAGDLNDLQKLIVYRAYKNLNALALTPASGGYAFKFRVRQSLGGSVYLLTGGTVTFSGTVAVSSQTPTGPAPCPICLAATTIIATPTGNVLVTEVKPGMLVWTATAGGRRVAVAVQKVGSMPVPLGHLMVHLVLADGRELLVSPGHRTGDGRPVGTLDVGDVLDGSTVSVWELLPYAGERTYDLLPGGPTGTYWADGILLSSTLTPV